MKKYKGRGPTWTPERNEELLRFLFAKKYAGEDADDRMKTFLETNREGFGRQIRKIAQRYTNGGRLRESLVTADLGKCRSEQPWGYEDDYIMGLACSPVGIRNGADYPSRLGRILGRTTAEVEARMEYLANKTRLMTRDKSRSERVHRELKKVIDPAVLSAGLEATINQTGRE